MINPDQYLYINWEDEHRNLYRVGILARIDDVYYLKTFGRKLDAERDAYSHGYVGLPGFIPGEIYKSTNQLFDFFVTRVIGNRAAGIDYMEELKKTEGKLLTDSFSIEEMPEKYFSRCKEMLLLLDRQKEELKRNAQTAGFSK